MDVEEMTPFDQWVANEEKKRLETIGGVFAFLHTPFFLNLPLDAQNYLFASLMNFDVDSRHITIWVSCFPTSLYIDSYFRYTKEEHDKLIEWF